DSVDGDLTTLDVSQIQARKPDPSVREVSRLTWQRATIPQNTAPMVIKGHRYLLEFDEFAFRFDTVTPADTVGAGRIVNVDDEAQRRVVSKVRLQVNDPEYRAQAVSDPGGIGGQTSSSGTRPTTARSRAKMTRRLSPARSSTPACGSSTSRTPRARARSR